MTLAFAAVLGSFVLAILAVTVAEEAWHVVGRRR